MILGQLVQAGKRFCECRSKDFVPRTEEEVVILAYTVHDEFFAHSFDVDSPELEGALADWLENQQALAYLLIQRQNRQSQTELPFPIGRVPMDRLTFTAATEEDIEVVHFYLEFLPRLRATKLVPAGRPRRFVSAENHNLLLQKPDAAPIPFSNTPQFEFAI